MKNIVVIATVLCLSVSTGQAKPQDCEARKKIVSAYSTIKQLIASSPNDTVLREQAAKTMRSFVDFNEFARLSLGKAWKNLDANQRAEYKTEFKALLERTYLKRFKTNQSFEVIDTQHCRYNKKADRVEIRTTIVCSSVETEVYYRFYGAAESWLVYDIVVDDISMMRNYRTSFSRTIREEGFDALLSKLRKSNKDK